MNLQTNPSLSYLCYMTHTHISVDLKSMFKKASKRGDCFRVEKHKRMYHCKIAKVSESQIKSIIQLRQFKVIIEVF